MVSPPQNPRTILLVGHGTRDAAGAAEFLQLAEQVAALVAPDRLYPCFLELVEPSIDDAVSEALCSALAEHRSELTTKELTVVPLLLFSAGHAQRDIPNTVAAAVARHAPGQPIVVHQTAVLDNHSELVALSAARYLAAIAGRPPVTDTCLVLVGRGSFDADATAAMHRFAAERAKEDGIAQVETAFIAMATPRYAEVLQAAATRGHARIVVQPHLLFQGQLLTDLRRVVAKLAERFTETEWIVAEHLGPDPRLAALVANIAQTTR